MWLQVDGCEKVHPIANEDLDRETEDKTSAVHFLRFELTPQMIAAAKGGAALRAGIDHTTEPRILTAVPPAVRESLVARRMRSAYWYTTSTFSACSHCCRPLSSSSSRRTAQSSPSGSSHSACSLR